MTIKRTCATVAFALSTLFGCTIARLQDDVSNREQHIRTQQDELKSEEARQAALRSERDRLRADLMKRQVSLDDLRAGLDQLQRENAGAQAKTARQIERKRQLDRQLDQCRAEISALKQDPGMTPEEKQRKIEHLKAEIRKALELLAES